MSEKELKALQDEETNKVSGGYTDYVYDEVTGGRTVIRCDNCGKENAYPINGGHLCEECLKNFSKIMKS